MMKKKHLINAGKFIYNASAEEAYNIFEKYNIQIRNIDSNFPEKGFIFRGSSTKGELRRNFAITVLEPNGEIKHSRFIVIRENANIVIKQHFETSSQTFHSFREVIDYLSNKGFMEMSKNIFDQAAKHPIEIKKKFRLFAVQRPSIL